MRKSKTSKIGDLSQLKHCISMYHRYIIRPHFVQFYISMTHTIGFASLGCPKALVDSERIITQLKAQGYQLSPDYQHTDLVIVNTCGFVEDAIEESIETIQEALDKNGKVLVTGCLGSKKELIEQRCPGVLHISQAHAYEEVIAAVHDHLPPSQDPHTALIPPQGIKLTPRHYAYLKISEGCNHKCTFCIIPSMRGKLNSYPFQNLISEAKRLKNAGVKELLVISQDTSAYGIDRKEAERFLALCQALGELGIWVRLHYVYPYPHVDDIIPLMAEGKILPYLDIPFQHASFEILRAMKRPASSEKVLERIKQWRQQCPELAIRSTFIVGFPGETEAQFQELLDFLTEAEIERAGCFKYSPVEGADANKLPDPIDEDIKEERYHRFMQHQAEISYKKLQDSVGTKQSVIIDSIEDHQIIGRTRFDAPEIDGLVYMPLVNNVKVGDIVETRIISADDYDRFGEILSPAM